MNTMIVNGEKTGKAAAKIQSQNFLQLGKLNECGVEWEECSNVTPRGGMALFGNFLAANGQFDGLVESCPLEYQSNNAPDKSQVLGTIVNAITNGAWRYAHISHYQKDALGADVLGIEGGFVSEDSVRRGLLQAKKDWDVWDQWLSKSERAAVLPLLRERYILDLDTSVKIVYGRQEGAEVGYNPTKHGRPSQVLHVGFIGMLRLLVTADVAGGKAHAACHMAQKTWAWIDSLPEDCKPHLIRGDIGFGNEGYFLECENRKLAYLFKIKMSKKTQTLIRKLIANRAQVWQKTLDGTEVTEAWLKLSGWSRERRVVVMRKAVSSQAHITRKTQDWLPYLAGEVSSVAWEYAVVACSADVPLESTPKLYAERADCENVLDELKNQWGLNGFTTKDLIRCKIMARIGIVVSNWWNVFSRIAEPAKHKEALTSRPELLNLMATRITHAGKNTIRFSTHHENALDVKRAFDRLITVFTCIESIAEQLDRPTVWAIQLSVAFYAWLRGKVLNVPAEVEKVVKNLMPPALWVTG